MLKITRCAMNPILSPDPELEWGNGQARNPAAVFDGEKFHIVFTAASEPKNGELYLGHGISKDGIHFDVNREPLMRPNPDPESFDHANVEDPRITFMNGKYYIVYAGRFYNSRKIKANTFPLGPGGNCSPVYTENFRRCGIAETTDFKTVKRLGPLTNEHICDANVLLLPEKINGKYAFLHRPSAFIPWYLPCFYHPASMWLAYTDEINKPFSANTREMPWDMKDGIDVPDDHLVIAPQQPWEMMKVGPSGVSLVTDDGLLAFYHGVDRQGTYRIGLLLLDRENPAKVLARTPQPIMEPNPAELALKGYYLGGCIFPCANVLAGDEIYIYYGIGDKYTGLATVNFKDALNYVKQFKI